MFQTTNSKHCLFLREYILVLKLRFYHSQKRIALFFLDTFANPVMQSNMASSFGGTIQHTVFLLSLITFSQKAPVIPAKESSQPYGPVSFSLLWRTFGKSLFCSNSLVFKFSVNAIVKVTKEGFFPIILNEFHFFFFRYSLCFVRFCSPMEA